MPWFTVFPKKCIYQKQATFLKHSLVWASYFEFWEISQQLTEKPALSRLRLLVSIVFKTCNITDLWEWLILDSSLVSQSGLSSIRQVPKNTRKFVVSVFARDCPLVWTTEVYPGHLQTFKMKQTAAVVNGCLLAVDYNDKALIKSWENTLILNEKLIIHPWIYEISLCWK